MAAAAAVPTAAPAAGAAATTVALPRRAPAGGSGRGRGRSGERSAAASRVGSPRGRGRGRGRGRSRQDEEAGEDAVDNIEEQELAAAAAHVDAAIAEEQEAIDAETAATAAGQWGPPGQRTPQQGFALMFPLTLWSITLSLQKQNVPYAWLDLLYGWMAVHAVAGFAAYERGTRNERGHIQAVMKLNWPANDAYAKRLKELLRALLGVSDSRDRPVFAVKPFAREQRWGAMLGYCQKDSGRQHYKFVRKGVSDEELQRAFVEYKVVSQSYRGNRKVLTRKDFGDSLHTFYVEHLSPYRMPVEQVLFYMISSELWVPDSSWLTPGLGQGVSYARAAAWYKAVLWPQEFTVLHAFQLFFDTGRADAKGVLRTLGYEVVAAYPTAEDLERGVTGDHLTGGGGGRFRTPEERMLFNGEPLYNAVEILFDDTVLGAWDVVRQQVRERRAVSAELTRSVLSAELTAQPRPHQLSALDDLVVQEEDPAEVWDMWEADPQSGRVVRRAVAAAAGAVQGAAGAAAGGDAAATAANTGAGGSSNQQHQREMKLGQLRRAVADWERVTQLIEQLQVEARALGASEEEIDAIVACYYGEDDE